MTAPGAPFAWSVVDIRGVPTRAYDGAPPSMALLWAGSVAHGDKDYIVYEDERLSYTEAHSLVDALCAHLASVGIGHGDRVAIAMRNYPEWVIGYWGHGQGRGGRCRHERLVDPARDGVRARRL